MRASGMGPGTYEVGGLTTIVGENDGVAYTADRKAFAGSISTVLQCLQQIVHVVGISLGDALRMATLTPAHIMGVDDVVGVLAAGRSADLLILDRVSLQPEVILLGGTFYQGGHSE